MTEHYGPIAYSGDLPAVSEGAGRWPSDVRHTSMNGRNLYFLRWVVGELGTVRPWVALLGLSVLMYAIGHSALALSAGLLGRDLIRVGDEPGQTLRSSGRLLSTLLFGLLGSAVKATGGSFLAASEARVAGEVGRSLRRMVLSRLLAQGPHDAEPRVLATIAVRVREVESATAAGAVTTLRSAVQLVPLALTLILLSPALSLAGALLIAPFGWGLSLLRAKLGRAGDRAQELAETLYIGTEELVRNMDLFRTYGAGQQVAAAVDETSRRAARAMARFEAGRAALSGGNEVLGAIALLGGLMMAALIGMPFGDGTVIAFATVFFMAYRPVRDLGDARAWCVRGAVALRALSSLVQLKTQPEERPTEEPSVKGLMRVERARDGNPEKRAFREPSARDSCCDGSTPSAGMLERLELHGLGARDRGPRVSLAVNPGELVAITGPIGSGKTTLLRVLLGLEPAQGSVRYGDVVLDGAAVGPTARPFAWVPQEAPLISGTVLENVALIGVDEARAYRALADIGASSLALRTRAEIVGPGGRQLSGGERRQVALARALAAGQPVLLLDEPTSGLDADAARAVLEALERLRGRRSVIVVTHDVALAAVCDRVLPLGDLGREGPAS